MKYSKCLHFEPVGFFRTHTYTAKTLNMIILHRGQDGLGPAVQSIVSLTSSLRGQLLSGLQLHNQMQCTLKFVVKKMIAFAFSDKKYWHI